MSLGSVIQVSNCQNHSEESKTKHWVPDMRNIIHDASPTGNTFHKVHPVESLSVIVDETHVGAIDSLICRSCYPLDKKLQNYFFIIILLNMV